MEITHAAGYEHPCQFKMDDVQVNVDDDYLSSDLKSVYRYQKEKVDFDSMQHLFDCEHLGGKPALEKTL